ncbi:right-handed parallel beta-helix repeat-containing protein [Streptomyces sp. MP131-18]|uniref:pectate lyase family protein n=1 Tax=Streptomyces sp. MP131-18 TaxID=1857892 RepID=UPI001C0ADC74|nr:right-handed parallel beta-helix repeat-containing protein [Streptomyces sp. MP131-18]
MSAAVLPGTAGAASVAPDVVAPAAVADGFASVSALGQDGTTGGAGGEVVTASTTEQFLDYIARPEPLVVQVSGTIPLPTGDSDGMHDVASDKTIVGLGADAALTGGGLNIGLPVDESVTSPPPDAVHNIIIRNLSVSGATDDLINVQMFSHHIWIDHNDFSDGDDGAVDVKRGSDYVTVSWNHFYDHDKTLLVGHDDDNAAQDAGRLRVTYHHNFFDTSDQRNPRVRFAETVHVYNNYYYDNSYGVVSAMDAGVVLEGNYFYSVNNPGRVDFSGDLGRMVERDNILVDCNHEIETRGSVAEPGASYDYALDPAADVPEVVPAGAGAGRIEGGGGMTRDVSLTRRGLLAGTAGTAAALALAGQARSAPRAAPRSAPGAAATADGFAGVNALGLDGTTGGIAGEVVTVSDADTFLDYCDRNEPYVIQVQGTIAITSKQGVRSDKTIVGLGPDAEITGGGLDMYRRQNVIIRNLRFTGGEDDSVSIQQDSHHIWIDHCEFTAGADGLIDIVRGADYITVSWNHFHTHSKTMLIGHSDANGGQDTGKLRVTFHHNFFDGTEQRHPRVRFAEPVHVFNNYYRDNALYGVASTEDAGVLVEGNYFENVPHPIYSGYDESGPGRVVERDNVYVGSGTPETLGTVVEPSTYYAYTLDDPQRLPEIVPAGAGVGRVA